MPRPWRRIEPVMRRLLALAIPLATAACTVGPNYPGPSGVAPPPPARFVRVGGATAQPAAGPWWTGLGDPVLNRLVERALAGNPDLDAAAARIRQARASLQERRAANLPALDSSLLYAKARLPGQSDDGGISHLTLYNVGFDSSWELDLFGGQHRAVEAVRAELGERMASLDDARVSLSAEVAQSYLDLRERQQRLALGEASLRLRDQQVSLADQRFRAGTAGRGPLLQAERDRADAAAQLAPLRAEIDAYKDKLATLTGAVPGALDPVLDPPAPIPLPPAQVPVGDPTTLLQRRPDVRLAERTLAAQTARIGVAQAARLPQIKFLGLFGLGGSSPSDIFDPSKVTVAIAPQLSWTFVDYGRGLARVRGARAQRDEAAARYRAAVLGALQDAESALGRFQRQRESLGDRARAEQRAADAVALARQRQQAGTIGLGDYVAAQQAALEATDGRQQATAALGAAFIAVQKSLGLGWQGLPETAPGATR